MAVTHVATGAKSAGGTTTVSIASPAGTASGQMLLAFRSAWVSGVSFTDETDWTSLGSLAGGTGSSADAHTGAIRGDRRLLSGSLAGPTVFDQTFGGGGSGCLGIMLSYENDGGSWDIATATGDDATHGTNRSITSSGTIALAVDDVVVVAVETDTDTDLASFANQAITASGITFGSTTRRTSGQGVNTGSDGNIEVFEATVTAGSGTVAVTLAFDTTTNQCGPGLFVRLREVSDAVDIATDPVVIDTVVADTTVTPGELTITTDPVTLDVVVADTTVTPAELTITTDPIVIDVEMADTIVEAGDAPVAITTDPVTIDVEVADTTVTPGELTITTDPVVIDVAMADTTVEAAETTITTDPIEIDVDVADTTVQAGETTILTDPIEIDVDVADTTVVTGEITITTDPIVIGVVLGVTSVDTNEPVAITTDPILIDVAVGTTTVQLGSDSDQFVPVGYWLEVWKRPGAVDFGKVLDSPPFREASYHIGIGLVGDGTMQLPDTFEDFDLILDVVNEVGSLIRLREDATGTIVGEWIPSQISPVADKNNPIVDVGGRGMNEIMEYAVTEPVDWDGSQQWTPNVPDWIWGGSNLVTNGDLEDGSVSVTQYLLQIDATGGSFTLTDGTDTTLPIVDGSGDFDDLEAILTTRIETDITALPDVVVDRTSIANPAYLIQYVTPPFGPTLSVNTGSLTGGTATLELEQAGVISPDPWEIVHNFGESAPPDDAYPFFGVVTTSPDTGTYCLLIDPPTPTPIANRQPGGQVIFRVTPGQMYQISVRCRPNSAADLFRWRLVTDGEEIIASDSGFLTAGVYQTLSLTDVVIPDGITTVAFRVQIVNGHPHNPSAFRLDNLIITEGFAATTVGDIITLLYEDACVNHVADGRLVWEDEDNPGNPYLTLDFDAVNDSSGAPWDNDAVSFKVPMRFSYLQMMEALESQENIEWRVVPVDPLTGLGGWLLQVYNEGGMDDTPAVTLHGGSQDTRRTLHRYRPMTHWLAEGLGLLTARATAVSGFGRMEVARYDRTAPDMAATQREADSDKANASAINAVWSYEVVDPQDAPLYHYRVGDTIGILDPPDVDESGRVWELNLRLAPEAVRCDVEVLKPMVEES